MNNASVQLQSALDHVTTQVRRVIVGHEQTVRALVGAFLVGGHTLLEGPPGIAKTLLARTVARTLGLTFKRIQFTPDLMPSDVTGVTVFEPMNGSFRFSPGPLFADIVLADEINRTPPKTQSSLLEAMEERSITIDAESHRLSENFFVIATQNPIEHEGTFPLPEAQLDRFLFKLHMTYPSAEQELAILMARHASLPSDPELQIGPVLTPLSLEALATARAAFRTIALSPAIGGYVGAIVRATRDHPDVVLGVSSRGALHLALASKLHAAFEGRAYVIPDDVKSAAFMTLNHRIVFRPEVIDTARSVAEFLPKVIERIPVPRVME